MNELFEDGYSGAEVRVTPQRTEVIIRATRTKTVLGEKGRRIRELTAVVSKRFGLKEGSIELYAERVNSRGLSAIAQAESLRYKLFHGLAVRRYNSLLLQILMSSEHVMEFSDLSWKTKLKVLKLSSPEKPDLKEPRQ